MEEAQDRVKNLPHLPGVYIYRDHVGHVLYVGKAKDLKKRVSQYFQRDDAVGDKTPILVAQIHTIETIVTDNEFDALLLEAKLIREHQPKYNVISRDDKSPLYIVITLNETLPRVIWVRKPSLKEYAKSAVFGPFQSGRIARTLLRDIRRVIPYCTQRSRTGTPCFYTHIGLCDPCPSYIDGMVDIQEKQRRTKMYRAHMRELSAVLSGKSLNLLRQMEREMQKKAAADKFEDAALFRDKINMLRSIMNRRIDPSQYASHPSFLSDTYTDQSTSLARLLAPWYPSLHKIHRVECYDISNTQGTHATASMVVLQDGVPDTDSYRRFRIRRAQVPNDFAMMKEVLTRRLSHPEWPYPDLFVIDGGKGQVSAAHEVFASQGVHIPFVGLAKRFEEIIIPLQEGKWKVLRAPIANPGLVLLTRIRDESHRFALRYHRLLRAKAFLQN